DFCTAVDGRHHLGMVAGFSSEWWPVSNRNPGRLHLGIPGRNASESAAHRTNPSICGLAAPFPTVNFANPSPAPFLPIHRLAPFSCGTFKWIVHDGGRGRCHFTNLVSGGS